MEKRKLSKFRIGLLCTTALAFALASGLTWGVVPKNSDSDLAGKAMFRPDLYIAVDNVPLDQVRAKLPNRAALESFQVRTKALGASDPVIFIDSGSGTAAAILGAFPVIPGKGVGNDITPEMLRQRLGLKMANDDEIEPGYAEVMAAVRQWVEDNHGALGIEVDQIGEGHGGQAREDLWHLSFRQTFRNVPVRYSRVVATVNSGNLVIVGTESWGNVRGTNTNPRISGDDALASGFAHAGGRTDGDVLFRGPDLEIIPLATANSGVGRGYRHVLTWTFGFQRQGEDERWLVTVDANNGEVLSFEDTNHALDGQTSGGVYPITSTEICPTPGTCGEMQTGWPMPFADTGLAAPNNFTNSAGLVNSTATITTTLSGDFININDSCGGVSVSGANGTIEMGGVNGDHNCTTGSGGSAGNTAASRTAFYELNKLVEQAASWLPNNNWMNNQVLTANLNLNNTCNAFWNGSTINFYRSGGGCRNTGELAGVFDHEWGHGLDDNDTGGGLSNTSEGYADIVGILRLHDSCVGHGFFETINDGCGTTSDGTGFNTDENQAGSQHCDLDCSGVRDADWDRHADHTPDTPLNFVCPNCNTGPGPCGRQVHCSAAPIRQAAWDLATRDLPFDRQTNFLIANKVFYQGSGNIGTWYSCTCTSTQNGCGSGGGYLQWLAADDNNGNINDGTPHMQAIFDAFNRHGIACGTPTPTNSGCAGAPTTAPTLSVAPGSSSADLTWNGVANADEYWVFRTEGHAGCDFGKALVGTVTGTSFTDTEVANGRDYWYGVMAKDTNDACFTAMSNCAQVTPSECTDCPTVAITGPADGSIFNEGDSINFTGTASDPEDGNISGSIQWSSSIDGAFGTGASVTTSSLSQGDHTITASVTDSNGNSDSAQIGITIRPGCGSEVYATDFEADNGGWVDGASTCTTGTFIRGTPDLVSDGGVTTQPNGASGGTFAWFTQNNGGGVGTDDVDGGTCETLSPSVNVGAGSSVTVFIDYYHGQRDAADDAGDGFSLELINADTGAVLSTLASVGDVANNAVWTATFDNVASAPANVQLRVRATDAAGAGDLVEAGIDNVQICTDGPPPPECVVDADCDNGLFCDGVETCNTGTGMCEAGTAPNCDDGVSCTVDSCNETTDSCDNVATDSLCDNGLFCDGAETCNATLGCQAGTAPNCDDGVSCTNDSCNETTDSCDNAPDDTQCDNGLFCDGAETCNATLGCQAGSDPCSGGACDETNDVCLECTVDADCNDGLFCNGTETCVNNACQAGSDPCAAGESCDETGDVCVPGGNCSHSADFESGNGGWTQGADTCTTGSFIVGTPDATTWQVGGGNPGQAFFTQNNPGGIGTDDVDGGTCEALSPVVDCGGVPSADVTLDYYHGQRDAGDDAADGFTIEVLNNGVVVDTIVAIGDVTNNPAWTTVSTNVANPGDIQVRVRATDAPAGGDIVEGGIDNVTISAGGAPPTCTTLEDFEGGLNGWANSGDCTTGTYVTGSPTQQVNGGVTTQVGGPNGGAAAAFTATNPTSAGVNDVDGGNCILTSPNLGAVNGDLNVAWFHGQRDAGDDAAGDFFTLEYSTDGGVSWNTLASNGDATSNAAWATATAAVNAGSLQVRVQCSDGAGPGDLVECGIDDVEICTP